MVLRAGKAVRWVVVTVGVIALTSVTVDATLNSGGVSQSALGILATSLTDTAESGACPVGMVPLVSGAGATCIDQYEVSPGSRCPVGDPKNSSESQENVTSSVCEPESVKGRTPWRQVTREQAALACAKVGKRLPTNKEWYAAALGTPDADVRPHVCHVDGNAVGQTGAFSECVSASGAYDMIGNVWEWVEGDVYEGVFNGRELPESGFVTQVDSDGVAVYTDSTAAPLLFSDYVWTSTEGTYGMIRGGYYDNGNDAGVYALNAYTLPTTPGTAIGFRCVQ